MMILIPMSKICLLVLLLVVGVSPMSKEPTPVCTVPKLALKDLPISPMELQTFNMNNFFGGYNVELKLVGEPSFVQLTDKLTTVFKVPLPQSGLKSYHLSHNENGWGPTIVTLSEEGDATRIRWGAANATQIAPVPTENMVIENDKDIICFDAVWFRDRAVILVDCTQPSIYGLENVFLYINSTSQTKLDPVVNDMYVPFNKITRRKIYLHYESDSAYLVRSYFADGVDQYYIHNTYVEIMVVNDPLQPWTLQVMDRAFLHQDRLSITDFRVYLGDMYILDYHTGVSRFDITLGQRILITGRYRTDSGYTRMGIYSSNMANQILLVLANDHAIYEIDWTNQLKPGIIAKYSIMDNSRINSLWVNERYVIAQIDANVTAGRGQEEYNSTFVFGRGTRTYLNAYKVVPHSSNKVLVDFHRDLSIMLIMDEDGYALHQLSQPILSILPDSRSLLSQEFIFTVEGLSRAEYSGQLANCSFVWKFLVVEEDSLAIWPTGLPLPDTFYMNYPGSLYFILDRVILGSNLTYEILQSDKTIELPPHWILQQNDSTIKWSKQPDFKKITFLKQEQYDTLNDTELFLYIQDSDNTTHVAFCRTPQYTVEVDCEESFVFKEINEKIDNLTASIFEQYQGRYVHVVAVLYEGFPNQVLLYDVGRRRQILRPIMFPQGYEGRVTSVQILGHFLVVVLRYTKQIVFYDLKACYDHQEFQCDEIYRIDAFKMRDLGVKYFSPLLVQVSPFHPNVLFIQNTDCVIIIDFSRNGPVLLAIIDSPGSKEPGLHKWRMAIAEGHLLIINPPNIIEEFSLDDLYIRKTPLLTKTFPMFNYELLDNFDVDFSDQGNLVYITAVDTKMSSFSNSVILVYRTGLPSAASFYDVFHLNRAHDQVLISATGTFADYITIATGSRLQMFRQYEFPVIIFESDIIDFKFTLAYGNDPHNRFNYSKEFTVKISNYPTTISIKNATVANKDFLSNKISYNSEYMEFPFDDSTWFNGTVLNYTLQSCTGSCAEHVEVINHLEHKRDIIAGVDLEDYDFTVDGGFIQQYQSVIKMNHNGSIDQYAGLPTVTGGENCRFIKHSWQYNFTVSACVNGLDDDSQVYLYLTTYTASKPFSVGPYYSSAKKVASLHIQEDIMVLVDVDENPSFFNRDGGVIIYSLNHNSAEPEPFDELQYISTDDLSNAVGWPGGPVSIGNAELLFTNETNSSYRLIITELTYGVFIVDFSWTRGRRSIELTKIIFSNIREQLYIEKIPMPNVAYFEAVAVINLFYENKAAYWRYEILLTTRNFHNILLEVSSGHNGSDTAVNVIKIFYRYGFYETTNYIKAFDGYFAIVQKLPVAQEVFPWFSRQVLTVYDTHDRWNFGDKKPKKYFGDSKVVAAEMLGGMALNYGRVAFDFNATFTRNFSDPFKEVSMVVVHSFEAIIRQIRINDNITIITRKGLQGSQFIGLKAQSDFSDVVLPLNLFVGDGNGLAAWAISLIVIFVILIVAGIIFVLYKRKVKRSQEMDNVTEVQKSLLEQEAEADEGDDDEDDEDEDEDEEEDQEEEKTDTPKTDKKESPSINRESVSDMAQSVLDPQPAVAPPVTEVKQEGKE